MKREIKKIIIISILFFIMSIIGCIVGALLYYRNNIGMGEYVKYLLIKDALCGGIKTWILSTIGAVIYIMFINRFIKKK